MYKTLYVTKIPLENIYDAYIEDYKLKVSFVNIQQQSIQYHENIVIESISNPLFAHQCSCFLKRILEIRLNSHLEIISKFTDEAGIFKQDIVDGYKQIPTNTNPLFSELHSFFNECINSFQSEKPIKRN